MVDKIWYVYIVECNDGTYYTGITNNVDKRLDKHNKGKGAKYTRGRGPVKLKWFCESETKSEAMKLERVIKKMNKTKKEEFMGE